MKRTLTTLFPIVAVALSLFAGPVQAGFRGYNVSGFRAPNVGGRRISR